MDLDLTYTLILILASMAVLIASAELLTLRAEFEDGGLFDWNVLRTLSRFTISISSDRSTHLISHSFFLPAVIGGRALAALLLIFFNSNSRLSTVCVLVIIAVSIALYWRAPIGLDGSDQMSLITFVAVAIYKLFPADIHIAHASLWFIAVQGCLSYFVAGIAKVFSPVWRSGEAVRRILSTRTYGSSTAAYLVSGRDAVCVALSWLLMLFECAFPLVLVFGKTGFAVFAVLGILFHITNAVIMGLNTFVWAFVASYPAILFCAVSLRH